MKFTYLVKESNCVRAESFPYVDHVESDTTSENHEHDIYVESRIEQLGEDMH